MFPGGANETTALDPELSAAPLTVEKKNGARLAQWTIVFQYFRQFKEKQGPRLFYHFCTEALQSL